MRETLEILVDDLISDLMAEIADASDGEYEYGEACAYVAEQFQIAADAAGAN